MSRRSRSAAPIPLRAPGRMHAAIAVLAGTSAVAVAAAATAAQQIPAEVRAQYDSAYFAWDRGDYVRALDHAERVLTLPGGEALLERVALLTGELYRVHDLAPDGRLARWSPNGRHASFETGTGSGSRVHLFEISAQRALQVGSFVGWDANFSPDGRSVAYLRVPGSAALEAARADEQRALAAGDGAALRAARGRIAALEAAAAEIVVRTLADGRERTVAAAGLERFALAYAGDGTLILLGRQPGEGDRVDLYAVAPDAVPRALSGGPGQKGARLFPVGSDRIVYTIGNDRIAIQSLAGGEPRILEGSVPTVSRDGSTLAYLSVARAAEAETRRGEAVVGADARASGNVSALMVLSLSGAGEPRAIKRTTLPLADPALSPSGARVAYTTILRDDWEIFVMNADGSEERRLTREIQHDLFPHFLSETLLLGMMGEARHRRSYLYDLSVDAAAEVASLALPGDDRRGRVQLFHNNTIRTVTPQYEWVPSPDGSQVMVVADRDGDTLSPERSVHLVDLTARVTREEVLARVRFQRQAEVALRERGRAFFSGIEAQVRAATEEVDAGRVYDHAHALYQFGSKFITQPGNALAIEYLANALRAMGYEPELEWFEPRPGIRSANVIATLRGTTNPERIHSISSHFDSVERAPGADDNSSGTTALLEAARVLAGRPQPETIRFVFLTAEEAGLLGAREHVRRALGRGDRIVSALNNDMIGWTRSHRLDNTIRYSNETVRDIQHNAAILFSDLITYDSRYVRSTDAQAFWDNYGDIVGGIGSYPILGNPHYHQPHDQLEVIDHRLVAEVARTTVASVMRLANGIELEN